MTPEDLKSKVNLRAIVARSVPLRQVGGEWMGKCPFHEDDTPSFAVNEDKGLFYCHGCAKKGDIFTWFQLTEGLDFAAAKARVAETAGLNPDPAPPASPQERSRELTDRPMPVAYYGYVDENGGMLYEIVRSEWIEEGQRKKKFAQRFLDPEHPGKYKWNKHPNQVLFRLNKVAKSEVVWFAEGEKCVVALEKLGLTGTCIAGGSKARWLSGFTVALAGKKVYILPDNDEPGRSFAQKVRKALEGSAKAYIVPIPGEAEHSDIADWVEEGHELEELLGLARQAEEDAEKIRRDQLLAGVKREPYEIGKDIMQSRSFVADQKGYVWEYTGRSWESVTDLRLCRYAQDFDDVRHTNRRRRGEIADYIRIAVQQPEIKWRQVKDTEIPLANGVYDLRTETLRAHRPEDYLETYIPVAHVPDAQCPLWNQALYEYFRDDEDGAAKVQTLQQFAGYCLMSHAKYKRALILYGESDTGKSLVAMILRHLVGGENTCAVSLEAMDDPRRRVPLVGRLLNMMTELSARAVIADGGFKALISTEEPLTMDPKHLPAFEYLPIAKHLFVCNVLPKVDDYSKGVYNRLIIVKFNRIIPKKDQDRNFLEKLLQELPGILQWALLGARSLIESGGEFLGASSSEALVEEYRREQNPIYEFLLEKTIVDPDGHVTAADVRDKFITWARRTYSPTAIGHMMRAAGYPSRPWPGEPSRRHVGLKWRDIL